MKRTALAAALLMALGPAFTAAQGPAKTLDIYVPDAEGGKIALFVAPSGQTVLVDTGSPGARDHDRLMEVIAVAGVKKIDYLISTHYHVDHIGGLQELVTKIPVDTFVDHGPSVEAREQVNGFQAAYAALHAKAKHMVVKPGDRLPLTGIDWRIVTSAGQVLKTNLPGGGQPNPACADFERDNNTGDPENAQSIGSVVAFGQFRLIDLGDLLWNVEGDLMCPTNRIGTVDLYMVSHHGTDPSGSKALVHGLRPRVAVMQNGTRKGGTVKTWDTLQASPGFQDLWQAHWSYNGLIDRNPAGVFIANIETPEQTATILTSPPPAPRGGGGRGPAAGPGAPAAAPTPAPQGSPAAVAGQPPAASDAGRAAGPGGPAGAGRGRGNQPPPHTPAHWIKISVQTNGTFTVTNSRNGFTKTYVK